MTIFRITGRRDWPLSSKATLLAIVLSILSPLCVAAQTPLELNMDWFTLDGGGDTSSGGDFTLTGGISPVENTPMSGGDYGLVTGFLSILPTLDAGEPPVLRVKLAGPNAVLVSWHAPSPGWVLEQSPTLGPSWTEVNAPVVQDGTDNTVTLSPLTGSRFYRLRHP